MGKYDHINFKPPESVAKAAEKGLEYRRRQGADKAGLTPEEASKEGVGSGVQRATNLKNRDNLSPDTIRQMSRFFSRHEKNKTVAEEHKNEPWKDKGYVSWYLWGGDPGKAWVEKVLRQMDAADEKEKKTAAKKAPSFPYLTDQYEPTNPSLWEKVKEIARGDANSLTVGSRTINAPSSYTWPSPPASAWAVKQYNGFGGGWRKVAFLRIMEAGGIVLANTPKELTCMQKWASQGLVQEIGNGYWEGSSFLVRAALGEDLRREPHLATFAADEGGMVIPKGLTVGGTIYINKAGLTEANLRKYVKRLETILSGLNGWRVKATSGGLKVALASPKDFRGFTGGVYKEGEDTLYVRTTPAVFKRSAGYGSFEYILVHELGHRYEKRYGTSGINFDRPEWWTTRYSRKEGLSRSASFAELFALGHFKLQGSWDPNVVERFDRLMTGGKNAKQETIDPKNLRRVLDKAISHTRDYPAKIQSFKTKKQGKEWVTEAFVGFKYPTSKVPIRKGKEPTIAPLRMIFTYGEGKQMSLRMEIKSPVLGTTKKIYENHRITGDYERTIRAVLLSYQPEIIWK